MARKIVVAFCFLVSLFSWAQNNPVLYQDDHQKVSFKFIDEQYGYILEEYDYKFGGTLVKFQIHDNDFMITELDTTIVVDSILFYDSRAFKRDSVMLSLVYRVNEFSNTEVTFKNLKYIINDSITYTAGRFSKNDNLHRALIPKIQTPYKLEIVNGYRTIGPFTITSSNDVSCKIVILCSSLTDEFDYGKLLPKTLFFKGKEYNLIHSFEPWNKQ